MRFAFVSVVVVALVALAAPVHAQPGPDAPPPGPQPYPAGPPPTTYGPPPGPPGAYLPPPYQYRPPMSEEDAELLRAGYIQPERTLIGGVVAIFVGWGIGQAVEGRWHDTGWIFSLGETASVAAIIGGAIGILNCEGIANATQTCSSGDATSGAFLIGGALALTGFRIWEVIDAFVGPSGHNERVHELRQHYGYRDYARTITPYLSRPQASSGDGMTAGLALRF
jgi:hypothetical protein